MTDTETVVDTFTTQEFEDTHIYLYGDRLNYCLMHHGETRFGYSDRGPLHDASAAWTDWREKTPHEVIEYLHYAYERMQDVNTVAHLVGQATLTIEEVAAVVVKAAAIATLIAALTGVGAPLAATFATLDAAAIKTERMAHAIHQRAVDVRWELITLVRPLQTMEVLHGMPDLTHSPLAHLQEELNHLLDWTQAVLHEAVSF